jgi:hypothetical protein
VITYHRSTRVFGPMRWHIPRKTYHLAIRPGNVLLLLFLLSQGTLFWIKKWENVFLYFRTDESLSVRMFRGFDCPPEIREQLLTRLWGFKTMNF